MGGYGSGRWHGHIPAPTVEDSQVLTLTGFKSRIVEVLTDGGGFHMGQITWSWRGEVRHTIGYRITRYDPGAAIWLDYNLITSATGEKKSFDYPIRLSSEPRHFGGQEFYFHCPTCNRRCAKLYRAPMRDYFTCRQCARVTYTSSQESHKYDRMGMLLGVNIQRMDRLFKADQRLRDARSKRSRDRAVAAAKRWGLV